MFSREASCRCSHNQPLQARKTAFPGGAGTILLSHAAERGTAADFVALVLTQDLASSFGLERFAADSGSHERHIIGSAIGAIPDAANWLKQLWATLFHLRDRARRYRHGPD